MANGKHGDPTLKMESPYSVKFTWEINDYIVQKTKKLNITKSKYVQDLVIADKQMEERRIKESGIHEETPKTPEELIDTMSIKMAEMSTMMADYREAQKKLPKTDFRNT